MAEQINSIQKIVDRLNGPTAMATRLGTSQPSVSSWIKRGSIPAKWADVIRVLMAPDTVDGKVFRMKALRD